MSAVPADDDERDQQHLPARSLNPFGSVAAASGNAIADASAAREVAEVQAAMIVAQRFPRDPVVAMDRILNAFSRAGLAEASIYSYARGGSDIEGLSIRAAEAIAQQWGHIQMGVRELDRRNGASVVEAFCFDAQTGMRDSRVFQVRHWRDTKQGGYPLKDERDIYELVANQAARRKRAAILAVIPVDVQEAVKHQINVTLKAKVDITPELLESLRNRFAEFDVPVAAIEKRIQRRLEAITPAQVIQLGKVYNSLKDGLSVAADWFELEAPAASAAANDAQPKTGAEALRRRAKDAKKEEPKKDDAPNEILGHVLEALDAATTRDKLDDVAIRIDGIRDLEEREAARVRYHERLTAIEPEAK